jgi:hypothetical protein
MLLQARLQELPPAPHRCVDGVVYSAAKSATRYPVGLREIALFAVSCGASSFCLVFEAKASVAVEIEWN